MQNEPVFAPETMPLGLVNDSQFDHLLDRVGRLEEEGLEDVIDRLVDRENFTEKKARGLRIEFLRFVSLKYMTDKPVSPSAAVDVFWHTFILDTSSYAAFCQRHLGCFLHHRPHGRKPFQLVGDVTPGTRAKQLIARMYPTHDQDVWAKDAICDDDTCDA